MDRLGDNLVNDGSSELAENLASTPRRSPRPIGNVNWNNVQSVRGSPSLKEGNLNSQGGSVPRRSPRLASMSLTSSPVMGDVGVENVPEPAVGMVFSSMKDVEAFYKRYGESQGFGVIRQQGCYNVKKERRATTWRCECWGDPDLKAIRRSKRKAKDMDAANVADNEIANPKRKFSKKCNCTAMIYGSINEGRQWVIKKVILDHVNHNPRPSQAKLVKEYRMKSFNRSVRRRLLNDIEVGVPVAKIHSSMARDRGGYENMPLTEMDM